STDGLICKVSKVSATHRGKYTITLEFSDANGQAIDPDDILIDDAINVGQSGNTKTNIFQQSKPNPVTSVPDSHPAPVTTFPNSDKDRVIVGTPKVS
ncbi:MAG: hypothetical protein ACRCXZ_07625, partial [Patescibacteria group bacterium]